MKSAGCRWAMCRWAMCRLKMRLQPGQCAATDGQSAIATKCRLLLGIAAAAGHCGSSANDTGFDSASKKPASHPPPNVRVKPRYERDTKMKPAYPKHFVTKMLLIPNFLLPNSALC